MFCPEKFKKPITVIGAGATGSYVVWLLAKMGCRDIAVWDFDDVEPHNPPNQIYGPADKGKKKVQALADMILPATGISIKTFPERFTGGELKGIVFVLTDTMESRKQIWDSSIKYKLHVDLLVEPRMGAEDGRVYVIQPARPSQVTAYEKTLYADTQAQQNPCTRRAIAPTVAIIAGLAVSGMLNFLNDKLSFNEAIISLSPLLVLTKLF